MSLTPRRNHSQNTIQNNTYDYHTNAVRTVAVTAVTPPTITETGSLALTITGTGATAVLPVAPADDTKVTFILNENYVVDSLAGSGIAVVGTAVTLDNALLGFTLVGGDTLSARYESVVGSYTFIVESPAVTLTGTGATIPMSAVPVDTKDILVLIDGKAYDTFTGGGVSYSSQVLTLDNAEMGIIMDGTQRVVIQYYNDPTAIVYTDYTVERVQLTATATGAVGALSGTSVGTVTLFVDGTPLDSVSSAALSVSGTTLTLDNVAYGGTFTGGERAVAQYYKVL